MCIILSVKVLFIKCKIELSTPNRRNDPLQFDKKVTKILHNKKRACRIRAMAHAYDTINCMSHEKNGTGSDNTSSIILLFKA